MPHICRNIQLINNSDKRDGNTLLLSSQSYRKKSKVTVSECIKPRNKKKKGSMLFLLLITSYKLRKILSVIENVRQDRDETNEALQTEMEKLDLLFRRNLSYINENECSDRYCYEKWSDR